MGFQLGKIAEETNHGILKGIQREIACDCWFTSKGKTIPRAIKVMDEEGMVHNIEPVEVLFSEEKTYSGIPTVEHVCNIALGGRKETIKLVYSKHNCKWTIVII